MKKMILTSLVIVFIMFGMTGVSYATPMHYTFEGDIRLIQTDELGLIEAAGLEMNSKVTYTYLVDLEKPGYYLTNGVVSYISEDTSINDWFFCDLVSKPYLKSIGFEPDKERYRGQSYKGQSYDESNLSLLLNQTATGEMHYIGMREAGYGDGFIQDWKIGQTMGGWEYFIGPGDNNASKYNVLLTLTNIELAPVPEPSTVILFSLGILGLAGVSRKKQ
jgi:hypothetical protein